MKWPRRRWPATSAAVLRDHHIGHLESSKLVLPAAMAPWRHGLWDWLARLERECSWMFMLWIVINDDKSSCEILEITPEWNEWYQWFYVISINHDKSWENLWKITINHYKSHWIPLNPLVSVLRIHGPAWEVLRVLCTRAGNLASWGPAHWTWQIEAVSRWSKHGIHVICSSNVIHLRTGIRFTDTIQYI